MRELPGFVYALEPLLRLRQWRIDSLQVQLGQLQREMDGVTSSIKTLSDSHRAAGQAATRAFFEVGDSQAHARCLRWLVQLQQRRTELEHQLGKLQASRTSVVEQCRQAQQTLEAIQEHRKDAVLEHTREEAARSAKEADRDWLVRVATRAKPTPQTTLGAPET